MTGKKLGTSFMSKYSMIGVLILMILAFSVLSSKFFSVQNISGILLNEAAASCLALGAMFILITGEFDLSLGYNLCLCMVFGAYVANKGVGIIGVVAAILLLGTVCGLINGLLVVYFKISSFIVTLSLGLTLSGVAKALSEGGIISITEPVELLVFARDGVFNIGYCVILFLVLSIVMYYVLNYTCFGRHLYAVGISKKTAFLAGININRVRILAFTFAGTAAGIGGAILLGQLGSASSAYGTSLLLPAYAVVFLSKTSFKPGYINVPGVILSILIVAVVTNGAQLVGMPSWGNYFFEGLVLILAMWLSTKFNVTGIKRAENKQAA